ncbi:MAG: DNA polymerase III subunit beta [Desulfobulbaceae bacterium]|nr:DNA polymerase III subunit beta [Desulfobulbaceae bacterium]
MKFRASLIEFQQALAKTLPAIPRKATIPILEHLYFSIEDNTLSIIGTDQNITIMTSIKVDAEDEGKVLVPAKMLDDLVKTLGHSGDLEFITDTNNYEIKLLVERGKYNMKGLNPIEYLDLPELFESKKPDFEAAKQEGTIESGISTAFFIKEDIVRLAEKTLIAVSDDEYRPAMTGILLQFRENYVNAVSTDSYRLVKATVHADKVSFPQNFDVILPAKSMELLVKTDSDLVMSFIESFGKVTHARFDAGNTIFITRVINEKFPPYESVIPQNNAILLTVDRKQVLLAIKSVSLFANNITKQIKLHAVNNTLTLHAEDEETGKSGKRELPCDLNYESFEIGFNFKYLEEAFNNVDENETEDNLVIMSFSEPNKPALIRPKSEKEELLMLVMPVRIS